MRLSRRIAAPCKPPAAAHCFLAIPSSTTRAGLPLATPAQGTFQDVLNVVPLVRQTNSHPFLLSRFGQDIRRRARWPRDGVEPAVLLDEEWTDGHKETHPV